MYEFIEDKESGTHRLDAKPCGGRREAQRWLPFVQFYLPVDAEGTASLPVATDFARRLLNDTRLHTQVSWPKVLALSEQVYASMRWAQADLTEAAKYIPQSDLDMYDHYKTRHGSSCAHEVRSAEKREDLPKVLWSPTTCKWSEVNDYHLLRPREPELFLGPNSKTLVFHVNATSFDAVENLEKLLLQLAKQYGLPRCFPDCEDEKFVDALRS